MVNHLRLVGTGLVVMMMMNLTGRVEARPAFFLIETVDKEETKHNTGKQLIWWHLLIYLQHYARNKDEKFASNEIHKDL